ncbi:DUF3558 domain-containing protein [Amycolatopsis sp. H20-H5]|uniref:DUF3558 domain-containing protein n=1 Tax=Amycolatopsis sp. H20-H5 TaxID=3046309 RepID=UPI002DBB748E|nr:DUF3558 domain-containing protein [Amycolatopsis sp. H20-H5]MEC3974674.1 DUF3558 domain-containing protein [Amycolatopsis sp. H20-H5]
MFRTIRLAAAALAALGLLTACTGKAGGTAEPTGSAGTPSSTPAGAAPRVPAALPTTGLLADPCTALSAAQVSTIGLTGAGEKVNGSTGVNCKWLSTTSDSNAVVIAPLPVNTGGLSDIYAGKKQAAYFEPVTVSGYPAVFSEIQDSRTSGFCALWVGVTDQLAVQVSTLLPVGQNTSNPCPIAQKVADAMIQHLKGAA